MRQKSFIGLIIGGREAGGLVEFSVQDTRYPVDFGRTGRLRGWGPSFFITCVKGFETGKKPEEYTEYGPRGLARGVSVRCYGRTLDEAVIITKVVPPKRVAKRKDKARGR